MSIKLTRLFIAFFMRTEFIDKDEIEKQIRGAIYEFKKAQKSIYPAIPQRVLAGIPPIPMFSLHHNNHAVTVSSNKIEYSIDGIYDANKYNDVLGAFLATSKLLIPICVGHDNICGRIGMVNNSFLITDQGDEKLKRYFFKDNVLSKAKHISLTYVNESKFSDIDISKLRSISHGQIHLTPPRDGLLLTEDINIPQVRSRLTEYEINLFIDMAGKDFELDNIATGFKDV